MSNFRERIKQKGFQRSQIKVGGRHSIQVKKTPLNVPESVRAAQARNASTFEMEDVKEPQPRKADYYESKKSASISKELEQRITQLKRFQKQRGLSGEAMQELIINLAKETDDRKVRDAYMKIARGWDTGTRSTKREVIDRLIKSNPHIDMRPDDREVHSRRSNGVSEYV